MTTAEQISENACTSATSDKTFILAEFLKVILTINNFERGTVKSRNRSCNFY